jgi:PAS domain S-box-containing protein
MEEALRESEQRWRSLTEALPQLVWGAGRDGGCDYFSTQWTNYTGVAESDLLGWRWMDALHPDDREATRQFWMESVAGRQVYDVEYRIRRSDGTYGWFKTRGTPIRDSEGRIVKWFGTCTDITDRKRAEQTLRDQEVELRQARDLLEIKVMERTKELRRNEAYLEEAQRLSHTGSWAWNVARRENVHWSQEHYRLFGLDPQTDSSSFETAIQRIHPEDRATFNNAVERAIRERSDFDVDFRTVLPDGSTKFVHSVGHPVFSASGELVEFVGTVMDVTQRREAEKERERLRQIQADLAHMNRATTMGELTVSLAHEINQPIAAAITDANTCLRWLKREQPDLEEAREAASRVVKDATRAAEIVSRVRLLFKKGAPQRERVDVNDVIQEMIVLLRNEASRHSISVRTYLTPNLPRIMGDRVQLQQVLLNLMINSIDAMKDEKDTREITIQSQRVDDDHLQMSVSDTGVGLPSEQPDQIFNAFYTTKPHGTGMGLRISRSIVESHGGRLWASNNSPRGASFHFTLPINADAHE